MDSKILLAIGLTILTAASGFYYSGIDTQGVQNLDQDIQFTLWKQEFNKKYDGVENDYRSNVFKSNSEAVNEHNARFFAGLESFDLILNQFADLTQEEFAARYLSLTKATLKNNQTFTGEGVVADAEVDWSQHGAVTPVKNQGQCGSCWAFSAVGSIEGRHFQQTSNLVSFSEQELVDCAGGVYQNEGCNGGFMDQAFQYVIDNGLSTEEAYAYTGRDGTCKTNVQPRNQITSFSDVLVGSQSALEAAITQQPVSVAIDASGIYFQLYRSGVFKHKCGSTLDHGVLAIGYGTQDGNDYFLVKNSWGSTWGLKGYIRMARIGDGHGQCGIQDSASFAF